MRIEKLKWVYLALLSFIWGSSFILMNFALDGGLTALQLGALRIVFAGLFLLIIGFKSIKKIKRKEWKWVVISGFLGTFIPVFMFAYAQTEIDSAVVSILNSFTPLNTVIFGFLIFKLHCSKQQVYGVLIGLVGTLILIIAGAQVNPEQNYLFAGFVLVASICYAFNVNIIKRHLQALSATSIAVGNFIVILPPAVFVLLYAGFFDQQLSANPKLTNAILYVVVLAVFGTGLAKIMFNKLVQMATPVFATSVTYIIPVVASFFGILYGERLSSTQIAASGVILLGVYIANRKKS
jgi:drug/metabolite transporter (DMT)-like permease